MCQSYFILEPDICKVDALLDLNQYDFVNSCYVYIDIEFLNVHLGNDIFTGAGISTFLPLRT